MLVRSGEEGDGKQRGNDRRDNDAADADKSDEARRQPPFAQDQKC